MIVKETVTYQVYNPTTGMFDVYLTEEIDGKIVTRVIGRNCTKPGPTTTTGS